jgi:hypothetical protein
MPPTVIQQSDGMVGGMPQPAPLPNMPTAEMVTVPQACFHTRESRLPIQGETQK